MTNINDCFDAEAYLHRIGLVTPPGVTVDGLEQMHRAQVYTIPFENFDIFLGRGINLTAEAMFRKIVQSQRGGYCFELNGIFQLALRCFGFESRPLLARVHARGQDSGRTHQLSLVTIKGKEWIADTGFGSNGLRAPIPFQLDSIATQDGLKYRLIESPPYDMMLQVEMKDEWQDLYSFDTGYVCPADIKVANHYTSTHPDSLFTRSRVATIAKPEGRNSLLDFSLRDDSHGTTSQFVISPGQAYLDAIRKYFGIHLDVDYDSLKPVKQAP